MQILTIRKANLYFRMNKNNNLLHNNYLYKCLEREINQVKAYNKGTPLLVQRADAPCVIMAYDVDVQRDANKLYRATAKIVPRCQLAGQLTRR